MKRILVLGILLFISSVNAYLQKPPVVHSITVDPATDDVSFDWEPSPSSNIEKYKVTYPLGGGSYNYLNEDDPILGYDTLYTFQIDKTLQRSYALQAFDSSGGYSGNSGFHRPMVPSLHYDTCRSALNISWNPYVGWENGVAEYQIYDFYTHNLIDVTDTTFYVYLNASINTHYAFYIKAVSNDLYESTSFKAEQYIRMPRIPDTLFCAVSVVDEAAVLDFTIDPNAEINQYHLLRSNLYANGFEKIKEFNNIENHFTYTDNTIDVTSGVFYYKLAAVNICGKEVRYSAPANNILLTAENNNYTNALVWNQYKPNIFPAKDYTIIRTIGQDTQELESSYAETYYIDDFESLSYNDKEDAFCYYVTATDSNHLGQTGVSSNRTCTSVMPKIHIPNAITPNGDGKNEAFSVYFDFIPKTFLLIIYNRKGVKLFETKDPLDPWDGTFNGARVEEGVYAYSLYIVTSGDEVIDKSGHITVFYP